MIKLLVLCDMEKKRSKIQLLEYLAGLFSAAQSPITKATRGVQETATAPNGRDCLGAKQ